MVECHLAKVIVEGSNPFARSIFIFRAGSRFGHRGSVAQLVEQLTLNQRVQGSSPCTSTSLKDWKSHNPLLHVGEVSPPGNRFLSSVKNPIPDPALHPVFSRGAFLWRQAHSILLDELKTRQGKHSTSNSHAMKTSNALWYVALPLLMLSGCVTVTSPPSPDPVQPIELPPLKIDQESIHLGSGFGREDLQYRESFLATLNRLIPVQYAPAKGSCCVRDVQIDISYSKISVGQVMVGIFSTVVPILPLVKSKRIAECRVSYTFEDALGQRSTATFIDSITGSYYGWSLTRLASVRNLQKAQRNQAVQNAAKLLVGDLRSKSTSPAPVLPGIGNATVAPAPPVKEMPHVVAPPVSEPVVPAGPSCAILNFEAGPGINADEVILLCNRLEDEFRKMGRYKITNRLDMPQVKKDGELMAASSLDVAIMAGKALKVQYVVYGGVRKMEKHVTVDAYLVNVDTGITESRVSRDGLGSNAQGLLDAMSEVVRRLSGSSKK